MSVILRIVLDVSTNRIFYRIMKKNTYFRYQFEIQLNFEPLLDSASSKITSHWDDLSNCIRLTLQWGW